MKIGEIIPTHSGDDASKKRSEIKDGVKGLFDQLPPEIRDACFEYFSALPSSISTKIEAALTQENDSPKTRLSAMFDKWNSEGRFLDQTYLREDLVKFNEVELELKLKDNLRSIFSRYLKDNIMQCDSFEKFKDLMGTVVEGIWSQRGMEEIAGPERLKIEEMEKRYEQFRQELDDLDKEKAYIEGKIGNRKHIPGQLQKELDKVQDSLNRLTEKMFDIDYEHMDYDGARRRALRHEDKFKSAVYFSEYFSAEDYAVLLLEIFGDRIDFASKFRSWVNPELLDYVSKYFEEWANSHSNENPLIFKEKEKSDKTALLIQRFVAGLESYLRHKNNDSLSDQEKDALNAELPMILRMLQKAS